MTTATATATALSSNGGRKWTSDEEAALKAGVLKHGSGKWRSILKDPEFSAVLFLRSNVHLKDKWRNMNTQSKSNATNRKRKKAQEEAPRASKRKQMSRGNSLYASGTVIQEGPRRSTRIKMRPLEYWKGERFLYGRVHESLVTAIGVKYVSPSKEAGENCTLKVKSFVLDKYKELVDHAALH